MPLCVCVRACVCVPRAAFLSGIIAVTLSHLTGNTSKRHLMGKMGFSNNCDIT